MKVHTIDTVDALRAIVPEWETLTACAVEQNINYQPIPLISVLSNLNFEHWFVVCVWRDESLCGFFPMQADKAFPLQVERMSTLFKNHFMSCIPLVHQDYVDEALSAFWAWFNATPRMLHILESLPNSELGQRFLATARLASVTIEQSFATTRAIAPLAVHGDVDREFDQYLKSIMSAKSRSTYRRKLRKIQQMGSWRVEFTEIDNDRLVNQLDNLVSVESKSWKRDVGSAIALNPGLQRFITQTARYAAQNNRLLLVMAYIDDTPVAGMIGYINDGALLIYKLGFDETYRQVSVGQMVLLELVKYAMAKTHIHTLDSCAEENSELFNRCLPMRQQVCQFKLASNHLQSKFFFGFVAKTRALRTTVAKLRSRQ